MRLYSESVEYKSVDYFAGLLMRRDNPLYDNGEDVVARFHNVIGFLPAQMIGNKELLHIPSMVILQRKGGKT